MTLTNPVYHRGSPSESEKCQEDGQSIQRACRVTKCHGLISAPPHKKKRYVGILTHSPSQCDLTCREGPYKGNQVERRSLGWTLPNMTIVFIKSGILDAETDT